MAALVAASAGFCQEPTRTPSGRITLCVADIHDNTYTVPAENSGRLSIFGCRNGSFSGKVLAVCDGSVRALSASVTDLVLEGPGRQTVFIKKENISVRYAVEWDGGIPQKWGGIKGPDILLESPLPEFPASADGKAVVPVWVTVRVPKDAPAGVYAGHLAVAAEGSPPVTVPVAVSVSDWTLPDPQDYRVWIEVIQQPDTLAAEYGLPLWSERHWQMIGKSLRLISATGSRVVYIPLICRTNYGNEQSMVRWVKRSDGTYAYDYSVMERYLDCVTANLGTPKIVAFIVWENHLALPKQPAASPVEIKGAPGSWEWRETTFARALQERAGKGPFVTVYDPETKTVDPVILPRYDDPAAKDLWKPLWEGVRKRMSAAGLEKAMMLAQVSDKRPAKEEVAFWNEISGGLPWVSCSHNPIWPPGSAQATGHLYGIGTVGYAAVALSHFFNLNPEKGRYYGWQDPLLRVQYWRFGWFNSNPLSTIRHEAEANITGMQRGVGHIGGDFWPCFKNAAGKRTGTVTDRFPESYWHSLDVGSWLLAPGPDGPVATARLEVFREGVQECEARIAVERVLTDADLRAKLGGELAARAQSLLDERLKSIWKSRGAGDADFEKYGLVDYRTYGYDIAEAWKKTRQEGHSWFLASEWDRRAAALFSLAGEVEKAIGR